MTKVHTEKAFEAAIEAHLLEHGGYEKGDPAAYSKSRGLMPGVLLEFIQSTQGDTWQKLEAMHGDKLEPLFWAALDKAIQQSGVLDVLRHGFKFYGKQLRLAYFKPSHGLNADLAVRYAANRLQVVRQLHYDPANDNSLDIVLFLNGIPIVTAELKSPTSGQTVKHAKHQYRKDRDPQVPIFRFKERALVHFAVDPDLVEMTTELKNDKTYFLPFNRGNGTAAGNPREPGRHRTFYLWEQIWQRDSLLDILARFMHLQVEEKKRPDGKKYIVETMIFPRFHQLDAVRKLEAACKERGAGRNYLIQHSAGSGKSNSIGWLAHRLSSLHTDGDEKVYYSVIVLTDRKVLDSQLQETVYQFDRTPGVVEKIDQDSAQLAKALATGVPIIISTLHKFAFIQEKVGSLPDRRYAIIVDEAHSSQSGEMAIKVKEILADSSIADKLTAEGENLAAPDQFALRAALFRGPQPNMSFFAFTATPKYTTLTLFGHHGADGKPAAFHVYSMRQAIEEGFILDVLQGYTTYKTYFQLMKRIEDDPHLDKRKAARALTRFMSLHDHNIAQKTEVMIKHFRGTTRHKIAGQAKAMLVTASRLHAVRYRQAFDAYFNEHGISDTRCLVAFSGEVADEDNPDVTYTEEAMNDGIKEKELPERFASPEFHILIVAEKYQTGFDQPLLHTMYVDKRLSGIQAVQTLSRLNRTCRGKEDTFVLDFANEREEIQAAFQQYYEEATIGELVDPQRLYELQTKLDAAQIYLPSEIAGFAAVFFADAGGATASAKLNAWLDPAVDRFVARSEEEQDDFRSLLASFVRLYAFLAQIVPFADPDLEKHYAYCRMLRTKLPRRGGGEPPIDLGDDVALEYYRLRIKGEGDIGLTPGEGEALKGPTDTGTAGPTEAEEEALSALIKVINDRFGTDFTESERLFLHGVMHHLSQDEELAQAAKVNSFEGFAVVGRDKLGDALADSHDRNAEFINRIFASKELAKAVEDGVLGRLFRLLSGNQPA